MTAANPNMPRYDALLNTIRGYTRVHAAQAEAALGMTCLVATRQDEGRVELHGIMYEPTYGVVAVESHFAISEHRGQRPDRPDAACEAFYIDASGISHTQLDGGLALPGLLDPYEQLDKRLSPLGRRSEAQNSTRRRRRFAVGLHAGYPAIAAVIARDGHHIHHPSFRQVLCLDQAPGGA